MIKKLLLVAIVFIGFLAIGLHLQGISLTTLIGNFTMTIRGYIQPAESFIRQNAVWVGAAITATTTGVLALIRKVGSLVQAKNQVSQQLEASQNYTTTLAGSLREKLLEKDRVIESLREQATSGASELSLQVKTLQDQVTQKDQQLQDTITKKNAEISALQNLLTEYKMKERLVVK